jgi:hypoxanthine phosphoribosyltransferase
MNKLIINNDQFTGLVGKICRDITLSGWRPEYVVGLTRGGLTPAVMISHYFGVPCETLKVSLRDGGEPETNCWMAEDAYGYTSREVDFFEGNPMELLNEGRAKEILIVDDINDSGATINWIMEDWPGGCMCGFILWIAQRKKDYHNKCIKEGTVDRYFFNDNIVNLDHWTEFLVSS